VYCQTLKAKTNTQRRVFGTKRPTRIEGPARVLVAAEEPIAHLIRLALNHGRYATEVATTARDAQRSLVEWRPHMMIVDLDLRSGGALALVGEKLASRRVPVIALTTRGDLKTKLAAFDRGADDFVTVPFIPEELVARSIALMRRAYGEAVPLVPVINIGGLEIDMLNQRVCVGSLRVRLTGIEQAILYLLAANPGRTLDRSTILDVVWGADFVAESNLVDRHVRNVREKLHDSWRKPRYIATIPGKGYRFLAAS